MNKLSKLAQVASCIFYITLQVAIARLLVLFHTASCFVYVTFILLFPRRQEGLTTLLCIGFAVGLLIDLFYNSMGSHALATVLMVYSSAYLLKRILPTRDYAIALRPTLKNLGWKRFSLFVLPLISIHHAALFLLDAGSFPLFLVTTHKLFFSILLTYGAVLITQIPTILLSRQ